MVTVLDNTFFVSQIRANRNIQTNIQQEHSKKIHIPSPTAHFLWNLPLASENSPLRCTPILCLFSSSSCHRTSPVAQTVERLSTMWETWVRSLGWEDPLEKEMAIQSSTIAWKIPWTEEPGRLQSMGSQRVGHDWATLPLLSFFHVNSNSHQPNNCSGSPLWKPAN